MSDANYRVAWDGLVARFSNNYLLKKRHMNALFEYPRIKKESAVALHDLIDCFERNTKILDQLGEKTNGWGAMLVHLMVSKLDEITQKRWEENVAPEKEPTFTSLVQFLKKQTRVLDAVSVDQHIFVPTTSSPHNSFKPRMAKVSVNSATENFSSNCFACQDKHWISRCPAFAKLPVDKGCNSPTPSGYVVIVWDEIIWLEIARQTANVDVQLPGTSSSGGGSNPSTTVGPSTATISSNLAVGNTRSHVFLQTVLLKVKDALGRTHIARALLDSGSQANLMSRRLFQLLRLSRLDRKVVITGIGGSRSQSAFEVSTTISSRVQKYSIAMEFLVLDKVTDDQPSRSIPLMHWNPPSDIALADPEFFVSAPIDLVLGAQYFYDFLVRDGGRLQVRKFGNALPVFVQTIFGWVATGESKCMDEISNVSCHVARIEPFEKTIEKFWALEELSNKTPYSQEEEDCEAHFTSTHTRDGTGRYTVRYPKRMDFYDMIGESKQGAIRRFSQIEKRLEQDSGLRKQYSDFMQEYLSLGHMKCIGEASDPQLDEGKTVCYLPHHPVFKDSSSTTKVRVVFDGSAKTSTNYSLNDALLAGPNIQDDLLDLMLRFRKHAVALVADVTKMYRQIRVHEDDTPLQRIVWRFSTVEPLQVYELQTITYGLTPSSFLATRVLKQLALDSKNKWDLATSAVQEDFYMDDFLSGADSVPEAIELQEEVQTLMSQGGLELRKWCSNKVEVLRVGWETGPDQFCIEVQPPTHEGYLTKRKIFSTIAKLYDPLGLVSPVVAWAKIRMQQLWIANSGWDDQVPNDVMVKWEEFSSQLQCLEEYKVPRYLFLLGSSSIEFHVFTDASEAGYGACIYARSEDQEGNTKIQLIAAKSRVAPLKRISLPRLELCAALLGARLYARVSKALRMEGTRCWFWTDSTVTLHWIQATPNSWQNFIGNRTAEIQQLTHGHSWNHVSGNENPADHVSRGMLPKELIGNTIWGSGPSWLSRGKNDWPKKSNVVPSEDLLERRKSVFVAQTGSDHNFLFYRYSSFQRLVRITALLLRFKNQCQRKFAPSPNTFVSVHELEQAKEVLSRVAQQEVFTEELKDLAKNRPVSKRSPLRLLHPFLDENSLIRLRGRLDHSSEKYQTKHPIILPKHHPLTYLITEYYHKLCMHSGPRMTLASMHQEFWPVNGKLVATSVFRKCLQCFRQNPTPIVQPVGQLPKQRTAPNRAFAVTGVDFVALST
ncbi:uncharacterized protein LOC134209057 [Armigeres subalbatus]|uniref:uncharacterized protein LOC134209057 n=1 Tax=Armigeres subalbatus TaxID=124917 RepID=UPI002ED2DD87